jgi:hypothetical protein
MVSVRRVDVRGNWTTVLASHVTYDAERGTLVAHDVAVVKDVEFDSGHIYVMNEAGKTINVCDLDFKQKEQQHGNNGPHPVPARIS